MRRVYFLIVLLSVCAMAVGQEFCFANSTCSVFELWMDNADNDQISAQTTDEDKKEPLIQRWPDGGLISNGDVLGMLELKGGVASVNGIFAFEDFTLVPDEGVYEVRVFFLPFDSNDYAEVQGLVKVKVVGATNLVQK